MNSSSKRILSPPSIGSVAPPVSGRSASPMGGGPRLLSNPQLALTPQLASNAQLEANPQLATNPKVVVRPVQPKLTEERLMEMERNAYEAGYAAGESAGYQVGEAAAQSVLSALKAAQDELVQVRAQLLQDAEREVASLAVAVAGSVLAYEVDADHPVVLAGIAAASSHFAPNSRLTLRMHPNDQALLETHQEALLTTLSGEFDVVVDATITPGGVVVEGEGKLIDATLTTRFEQVVQQLLGEGSA